MCVAIEPVSPSAENCTDSELSCDSPQDIAARFHFSSCALCNILHYTDTGYRRHQRTSSQVVDVVQHFCSWLNLLYNILPATDTNVRAHNKSTTCCPKNSPPTDKNLPHPNILTCQDVGLWHCNVAYLL